MWWFWSGCGLGGGGWRWEENWTLLHCQDEQCCLQDPLCLLGSTCFPGVKEICGFYIYMCLFGQFLIWSNIKRKGMCFKVITVFFFKLRNLAQGPCRGSLAVLKSGLHLKTSLTRSTPNPLSHAYTHPKQGFVCLGPLSPGARVTPLG